jgi:hypothetical protein
MAIDEKEVVEWLTKKTDALLIDDSPEARDELAEYCAELFNENFEDYKKMRPDLIQLMDEMAGMHEDIEGKFEPKILHMDLEEIQLLSAELKKII